jgi:hypothetical protein
MRRIKKYKELFEDQTELTENQTKWLDRVIGGFHVGKWTLNPQTGLVDVYGNFDCYSQRLSDFKGVRFGVVTGDFRFTWNLFTSLVGAPQQVGGDFICSYNQLTSLEGAPKEVGGSFYCSNNELTSLEGAPQSVGWNFDCSFNDLTSLEGAPKEVGVKFQAERNPVSERTLEALYMEMKSGMSWPDAVAGYWGEIESDEDKILLAPYNPKLSPEDRRGYDALSKFRGKII